MSAANRLPPATRTAFAEALARAQATAYWRYPWDGIEEAHPDGFHLIGYGSLVHAGSAKRTLSSGHRIPVIVAGALRVFNYYMDPVPERYGPLRAPEERAALNVRVTYQPDHVLNGVLTSVPPEEIAPLRRREGGYDLLPVPYVPWTAPESPPAIAWILMAPRGLAGDGKQRTSDAVDPHGTYYALCREGAGTYGGAFLDFWLDSTFLADGVTPVREWERDAPDLVDGP